MISQYVHPNPIENPENKKVHPYCSRNKTLNSTNTATLCLSLLSCLLFACGGGTEGENSTQSPLRPTANAGEDQQVAINQSVILDGSQSINPDGDELAYAWSIESLPARSSITLEGSAPTATFIPDVDGAYVFSLTVSNNTANSVADAVVVSTRADSEVVFIDSQSSEVVSSCGNNAGAATMVGYQLGAPSPEATSRTPLKSLGLPDYTLEGIDTGENRGFVSLGCGGVIELEFSQSFFDGTGNDLHVFEVGTDIESMRLEISQDGETWLDYGVISVGGVDISNIATPDSNFRRVRLSDQGSACGSRFPGADLDAVLVLNCR